VLCCTIGVVVTVVRVSRILGSQFVPALDDTISGITYRLYKSFSDPGNSAASTGTGGGGGGGGGGSMAAGSKSNASGLQEILLDQLCVLVQAMGR